MRKTLLICTMACMFCAGSVAQTEKVSDGFHEYAVATPSLLENWYVQAGLDLSLQNPFGKDFTEVFPKGHSFGIHAALGKRVTPGLGLRGKLLWTNGLIKNGRSEWLAPFGRNDENFEHGGMVAIYGEVHLCFTNVIMGYDESRRWDISGYPRMGLIYNFAMKDVSPVIGVGVINTCRINSKWSLYFDAAYNVTTSEYTGNAENTWSGGGRNGNCNGYFDVNVGVQLNLGSDGFKKLK